MLIVISVLHSLDMASSISHFHTLPFSWFHLLTLIEFYFQNVFHHIWINCSLNFSRIYKDGKIIPLDDSLDYGGNFSHLLGFDDPKMLELMRLYITIHRFVFTTLLKRKTFII